MALTYTPPAALGTSCPDFSLPGTDGRVHSKSEFTDAKVLVVMFICNHCPYVVAVEDRLLTLARELGGKDVKFVAISSNDANDYPLDSFENMKKRATEKKYPFPYLYDEDQSVAEAFTAVCTPDFFVYDRSGKLGYRGRLDDSWKDPSQVKSQELREAILALREGSAAPQEQKPSMGCNIKWKKS